MSLAPPPCPPPRLLRAFRRDAALFAAGPSHPRHGCLVIRRGLGSGRAYCLFPGAGAGGRRKQVLLPSLICDRHCWTSISEEARRGLESALGPSKAGFGACGVEIDRRRQSGRHGGPGPAAGGGGRGRFGGGGGGDDWFRWFSSGGFWDAVKQTVLTILGIIAAFFLIANFNVLVAAALNPLLVVLRQIRRAITFAVHCVSWAMTAPAASPKPTPVYSGEVGPAAPVEGRAGMSAKDRVVAKWCSD